MPNAAILSRAALVCALAAGLTTTVLMSGPRAGSSEPTVAAPAPAPVAASFTIPSGGGYGLDACLTDGGACGSAVANAWCESHGFSRASSFGPADEADAVQVECKA